MTLTLLIIFEALQDIEERFVCLFIAFIIMVEVDRIFDGNPSQNETHSNDPFAWLGDKYQFPALHLLRIYLVYLNVFLFPILFML
uniref:Uncharacterized protein n=1 Tax=Glossina palpalis gambiensis TaxID=67801 RepID=A0A1B0B1U2_9MUSC